MQHTPDPPLRRLGKEVRERLLALFLLIPAFPVFVACALLIKTEGIFDADARGPVFFVEQRVSRGRVFGLLKFRVLRRSVLATLEPGAPTHIAVQERSGGLTRAGRLIRQWYLDELPQLLNIVRGEMFLIGTRPWPMELYEADLAKGRTLKRDMPAGLVGLVQAHKGRDVDVDLDAVYWDAYQHYSAWRLLLLDLRILARSGRTQLEHRGL